MGVTVIEKATPTGDFILCAPKILRTPKFAIGLAYGPTVVNLGFLQYCLTQREIPDDTDFLLHDAGGEKDNLGHTKLQEVLNRARKNGNKLLKGYQIFTTLPKDSSAFIAYGDIIKHNGGILKTLQDSFTKPKSKDSSPEELFLISEDSTKAKKEWNKFNDMAESHEMQPRIVTKEWLLSVTLQQELVPIHKGWLLKQ